MYQKKRIEQMVFIEGIWFRELVSYLFINDQKGEGQIGFGLKIWCNKNWMFQVLQKYKSAIEKSSFSGEFFYVNRIF